MSITTAKAKRAAKHFELINQSGFTGARRYITEMAQEWKGASLDGLPFLNTGFTQLRAIKLPTFAVVRSKHHKHIKGLYELRKLDKSKTVGLRPNMEQTICYLQLVGEQELSPLSKIIKHIKPETSQ